MARGGHSIVVVASIDIYLPKGCHEFLIESDTMDRGQPASGKCSTLSRSKHDSLSPFLFFDAIYKNDNNELNCSS